MQKIQAKAVLFDVGHTILFPNPDFFFDLATQYQARLPREEFDLLGARVKYRTYRENPENPYARWFTEWMTGAGVPPKDVPAILQEIRRRHEEQNLWDTLEPTVPEVFIQLRERGFELGVISNADGSIEGLLQKYEIDGYFRVVLDSAVVGVEKPDARIFLMAAEALQLEPKDCVYIGDQWAIDGQGAQQVGMHPVILDPFDVAEEVPCLRIRHLIDILQHLA